MCFRRDKREIPPDRYLKYISCHGLIYFNEYILLTPGARSKVHVKKILEASLLSIVTGSRSGQVSGSGNESPGI